MNGYLVLSYFADMMQKCLLRPYLGRLKMGVGMNDVTLNLDNLIDGSGYADFELDLTGLDLRHALESIRQMIERQRRRRKIRSVLIRLDPPVPGQGETLFLPVGKHLVELLKKEMISRVKPYADKECSGFVIHLPAGKEEDISDDEVDS